MHTYTHTHIHTHMYIIWHTYTYIHTLHTLTGCCGVVSGVACVGGSPRRVSECRGGCLSAASLVQRSVCETRQTRHLLEARFRHASCVCVRSFFFSLPLSYLWATVYSNTESTVCDSYSPSTWRRKNTPTPLTLRCTHRVWGLVS
jgi:hypothetical protein